MKSYLKLLVLVAAATAAAAVAHGWQSDPNLKVVLQPSNGDVVARGRVIYEEHCASCHGANLEGQPKWRQRDQDGYLPAPPHDASGHTWHHPDKQLFELTKYGLGAILGDDTFKTRMPAYKDQLTDREIIAVLSFIKSRWPKEVQERHDQINAARQPK